MKFKLNTINILFCLFFANIAYGCPEVDVSSQQDGSQLIVDYNVKAKPCGKIKILHIGDSNVDKITDRSGRGSWPGRLNKKLRRAKVNNKGISGITANKYLAKLKQGEVKNIKPDICVLGPLGINETIKSHGNAALTERDLRRIAKFLKKRFGCFVAVTTVVPIKLSQHKRFQAELNSLITRVTSKKYPILEFNISTSLFQDNVHPSPKGFSKMAKQAERFIIDDLIAPMRLKRPDTDGDGLSDLYEEKQSGTDPNLFDTDGNGFNDFEDL